ncbi:transcription repressor MYB5 [Brachypodium distachyon]|uniref:Uncharacterized protein n=1 Tax=Brachypodium distachyon TaxID=15368 RepID=I1HQN4_BRADI|nr:transcription repressor MYB5 [Brachypodium distachyon]KQK09332.1 hypothetical protein BRADI_2g47367v3 [Brachypodium distachyon]|eukprot:XP_003567025.1 transcription repressor MYB5 [Brachypodium distachyon]
MARRKPPSQRGARRSAEGQSQSETATLKRGPWTAEEDELLVRFVEREGEGRWRTLPRRAGLLRCGKSCRLRWMNYLRPDIKREPIADDEEDLILRLHRVLGNRWSLIAGRLPGRTDNEIKNYWNSHLSKKLIAQGLDPRTHMPLAPADNAAAVVGPPDPALPAQPTTAPSGAAGIGSGDSTRASAAERGDDDQDQLAATMSLDDAAAQPLGFEGFADQFFAEHHAARGGFDDMGCAMVDADDAFALFLDSLVNESQFVD